MADPLSLEARSARLAGVLELEARNGWRVISQGPTSARLAKGPQMSHLHATLSIITIGMWIPVWLTVTILQGQRQRHLSVDEYGNVIRSY